MINRIFALAGTDGASAPSPRRKGGRVFCCSSQLAVISGGYYVEVLVRVMTARRWRRDYAGLGPEWCTIQAGPVVVQVCTSMVGRDDERWGERIRQVEEGRKAR